MRIEGSYHRLIGENFVRSFVRSSVSPLVGRAPQTRAKPCCLSRTHPVSSHLNPIFFIRSCSTHFSLIFSFFLCDGVLDEVPMPMICVCMYSMPCNGENERNEE